MNKQEQEKIKKHLLERKKQLEKKLGGFARKNPEIEDDWKAHYHKSDPSDTADEKAHSVTDYERERALEQELELELKEVNEALEKIDAGAYGACHNCKTSIQQKRLKAIPTAKFCIGCAEKASLV